MTGAEVFERLTEIVREALDQDGIVLRPESTAEDFDGWDSVAQISIIVAAERQFGIRFQTAETEELRDVGRFVELIRSKLH